MSWLSKAAKKVEKAVSKTATSLGVGKDLKKAANIFGAANVGAVAGAATGFLSGGVTGAWYGGATGAFVGGYDKYKGNSSSKIISNSAADGFIAGTIGPLIYKPAGSALISTPSVASGYTNASTITVKTASGSPIGTFFGGARNVFKDATDYIGKGGLTQLAIDGISKLFRKDPGGQPTPDYQQGNAIAPGGNFDQWLQGVLPGKMYDPSGPGGVSGGGGANPNTEVSVVPQISTGDGLSKYLIYGALAVGGFFLLKKGGLLHAR